MHGLWQSTYSCTHTHTHTHTHTESQIGKVGHVISFFRYDYGLNLALLSVDEGITGYRDDSLDTVKRNQNDYGLPLKIVSYEELYGWTMDAIVQQIGVCVDAVYLYTCLHCMCVSLYICVNIHCLDVRDHSMTYKSFVVCCDGDLVLL